MQHLAFTSICTISRLDMLFLPCYLDLFVGLPLNGYTRGMPWTAAKLFFPCHRQSEICCIGFTCEYDAIWSPTLKPCKWAKSVTLWVQCYRSARSGTLLYIQGIIRVKHHLLMPLLLSWGFVPGLAPQNICCACPCTGRPQGHIVACPVTKHASTAHMGLVTFWQFRAVTKGLNVKPLRFSKGVASAFCVCREIASPISADAPVKLCEAC